MVITYAGGNCFKLSAGSTTIAVNPPTAKSSHKVSKFGSDVVLISTHHEDWNGEETASHGDKEPFVIRGPGAYEIGDVVVSGYASPGAFTKDANLPAPSTAPARAAHADGRQAGEHSNTVYLVQFDGMKVLILGALSSSKLPQDLRADLNEVDILFLPLGEKTLDAKGAHDLAVALEAKLVIPYATDSGGDLKTFLKTAGSDVKPVEKLTLRTKDVTAMSGEIALLK